MGERDKLPLQPLPRTAGRDRADKGQRFSKKLLKRIFETIPDLLAVIDRDFRLVHCNWHGGYDYVDESFRDGSPRCYDAFYPDNCGPCTPCHAMEVFRTGKPLITEKYNPHVGTVEIRAYPLLDDDGQVSLVVEHIRDITERRRLEESLRSSKELLNAVIDGSPLPIFVIDKDHKVVHWNKALEICTGIGADGMIGTDHHWKVFYGKKRPCLSDLLMDGREGDFSRFYGSKCHKSGTIAGAYEGTDFFPAMGDEGKWLYFTAKVIMDAKGEAIGAVEMLEDITERKRIEEVLLEKHERLHAITESARDAIVMMDNGGRISFWNPAAKKIFGYTSAEALGKELHALLAPARYLKASREGFGHFGTTGEGLAVGKTLELVAVRKDGREIPVELSLSAFRIKGKWNAAGILRDITERKLAEAELIRTNRELKQTADELLSAQNELVRKEKLAVLGRLAGNVGHELRNPLAVMNNAVYFLKTVLGDADAGVREYLDLIKQEVDNASRIIAELLDFSRARPPEAVPVSVAYLVRASLGRCSVPSGIAVIVEFPEPDLLVRVDSQQIGLAFEKLVANAVDAMPDGGSLTIRAGRAGEGDMVEVRFDDTGEGIPEENLLNVFHPLFTTRSRRIGLGLTVCRNLVEANQGTVFAQGGLGGGASLVVLLPAAEKAE